jgi:predicted transposase YbfD/YdcC
MQYHPFRKCSVAENPEIVERTENTDKGRNRMTDQRRSNTGNPLLYSDENGLSAKYFNSSVRGHWGIENHLHRHLDVTFREDDCWTGTGYAPENLSALRKPALQIISEQNDKLSLKKRRLNVAYDAEYLKILNT